MKDDNYWKKVLQNPREVGAKEKALWITIEPLLIELFDELKENKKIEIVYTRIEHQHAINVVLNRIKLTENFNLFARNATPEKAEQFIRQTASLGFNEENFLNLIIEFSAFMTVMDFECFKTLILHHLKDVDYKASSFNKVVGQYAPLAWKKLKPYMYNDFRNALAHGTWTIENGEVVLFKDAKLVPFERLSLHDFVHRANEMGVLCNCVLVVISDKIDSKFFS
jgi:hypothetical protein